MEFFMEFLLLKSASISFLTILLENPQVILLKIGVAVVWLLLTGRIPASCQKLWDLQHLEGGFPVHAYALTEMRRLLFTSLFL
jgi:hypothetical protein